MSASPARRRFARGARFIRPDEVTHDFERSVCAMQAFRGADGVPLFAARCPVCNIPLTWTIKRDDGRLCLMEHRIWEFVEEVDGSETFTSPARCWDADIYHKTGELATSRTTRLTRIVDATARKTKRGKIALW